MMPVPARLSFATLGVRDLARATAFYQALGWELSSASMPEISFLKLVGAGVILWPFEELAADANLDAARTAGFGGIALAMNVDAEADVQPALEAAEAAGGRILKAATRADWGGVSGYFADLDGYPWEVAYNPFFPLDAEGRVHLP
jgi:catechol 2,3-dioxygenase-like lactoylglutathione lyase family enzyme